MTIPLGAQQNWCPSCEDTCNDHSRICTVCGTELQYPRAATATATTTTINTNTTAAATTVLPPPPRVNLLPVPSEQLLIEETLRASRELRQRLGNIRERIRQTSEEQNALLAEIVAAQQSIWQDVPPAWLDPTGGQATSNSRATSKECLKQIPRIVLHDTSALFRRASLTVINNDENNGKRTTMSMTAIPGEFGPVAASNSAMTKVLANARLVVAEPRTGKGGCLSDETLQAIQTASTTASASFSNSHDTNKPAVPATAAVVLYMERGDGVTFVQKALLAQQAGAAAVVIGNTQPDPWPYTMNDPKREAVIHKLEIPVIMVKQSDGQDIVACFKQATTSNSSACCSNFLDCALTIEANDGHECVVCREAFQVEQTVLQLPVCAHVFHQDCALAWLNSHNTCPYCRRELPTDDEEYEETRRREQRTHAGSITTTTSRGMLADEFYR